MIYRQSIVESGPTLDGARPVIQVDRHEDVVHRIERLRVKNGTLQVLATITVPSLFRPSKCG
jgi:hypothetical protein